MSTNFAKEFKLYEDLFSSKTYSIKRNLTETLNLADLETRNGRVIADGDEPLYTDLLYLKDINELAEYANQCWCGEDGFTPLMLREYVMEDEDMEMSDWVRNALEAVTSEIDAVRLRDAKIEDPDAYLQIKEIMETLHYDNGKPLSCDEYDYFDHYDREQEFWSFYEDVQIFDFITDGKDLYMRMNLSFEELRKLLTKRYDGTSWEHDFGKHK